MSNNIKIINKDYTIDESINNILEALIYLKENQNNELSFKYGCKSGVCGSCAIRVNGVEKLACACSINDNDIIEPLKNLPILKDLIVDDSNIVNKLDQSKSFLEEKSTNDISQSDVDIIDIESNCILCNSCYSSCPVYEVNSDFIGPFALARAYRYIEDKKEQNNKTKLDAIQKSGVWDCTLCGACDLVCPQNITIKDDIMKLQNISVQNGYENPAFSSNAGGFDSFDSGDFGFNPNGF